MLIRIAGALSLAVITVAPLAAQQQNPWTWRKTLPAGQTVDIRGISGDISATPASGGEVEVVARKTGDEADFDNVTIEVVEKSDGVMICAMYDGSGPCDEDRVRGRNRHGRNEHNDVSVDFEVRVPRGVKFRGATVSGDVEATGLTADVTGTSVSGDVTLSTSGIARATSVSGDVRVRMGRADWEGPLSFSTVSGDVVIEITGDLDAEVQFTTVGGELESDWPATVTGRSRPGNMTATIGRGGRQLKVSTVSGDLELRRAR